MSDSVRPRRWQPTRLPRPWDSPGKNTGVGCHFLLQCMKVKSESEVAQSCLTPSNSMDCSLPGSSVHGICQARVLEWVAIAFSGVLFGGGQNQIDLERSWGLLASKIHFWAGLSQDTTGSGHILMEHTFLSTVYNITSLPWATTVCSSFVVGPGS